MTTSALKDTAQTADNITSNLENIETGISSLPTFWLTLFAIITDHTGANKKHVRTKAAVSVVSDNFCTKILTCDPMATLPEQFCKYPA
jgi:hypothetical protein